MLACIHTRPLEFFSRGAQPPRRPVMRVPAGAASAIAITLIGIITAHAQSAPGFDPRAAARRFEAPQSNNPAPRLPRAPGAGNATASSKTLFVLRGVKV